MKYIVTINNKRYEVEVNKGQATVLGTTVLETAGTVPAAMPETAAAVALGVPGGSAEPVKAPMPGAVLDVKVTQGMVVKEGDVVVILEAMKMENELTAHKDGVISQIFVAKGSYVATNDVLVTIQ